MFYPSDTHYNHDNGGGDDDVGWFAKARFRARFVMHPGDLLYLPTGWTHMIDALNGSYGNFVKVYADLCCDKMQESQQHANTLLYYFIT